MKESKISRFRKYSLIFAESFDTWRIIPRIMLIMYSALVTNLYLWFKSIPTLIQEKCDPNIISMLLEAGRTVEEAKMFACSVVDVVGGPTAAQSAFVTTIIGLSTAIFGVYTTTGRRWENGFKKLDIEERSKEYDSNDRFPSHDKPNHDHGFNDQRDRDNSRPFPRK